MKLLSCAQHKGKERKGKGRKGRVIIYSAILYISKRSGADHTVLLANTPCCHTAEVLPRSNIFALVSDIKLKAVFFPPQINFPLTLMRD